jgi:uncharacterized protein YeeX (DUF496 family)
MLTSLVEKLGLKKWSTVASRISKQFSVKLSGKQCRERWNNQIDPSISAQDLRPEEQDTIFAFVRQNGSKWSQLAKLLPGRAENAIKNYFYCTVRKNIRRVNKRMVLLENINDPIAALMKNDKLADLICCSTLKSIKLLQKTAKEEIFQTEVSSEMKEVVKKEEETGNVNKARENWEKYCQQFAAACFWYPSTFLGGNFAASWNFANQ